MLRTNTYEESTNYLITLRDDDSGNVYSYRWGKQPPNENQDTNDYLLTCRYESELLAQYEIDKKQPPQ